jgi:hypothetical protein
MGHRQKMTPEERLNWDMENYKKRLQAKRGSNYEYWNEEKHGKLIENGYVFYKFTRTASRQWNITFLKHSTSSEYMAKKVLKELKENGNHARIICGYDKNKQRVKMYSVIYKSKNHAVSNNR